MSGRGFLSEEVKATSKRLLGYEISTEELRLMPYIQFTMMNNRRLDVSRITPLEREILSNWRRGRDDEAETIIETRLSAFNFARKVASNE